MRILSITSLFPNSKEPNKGIFVLNRLKALSKYAEVEVVAPIPWFPFVKTNRKREIPFKENIEGLKVYHPRFFSIPKFLKSLDGFFFYLSLKRFRKKIKKADIIDAHYAWPDGYGAFLIAEKYNKKFSITLRGKDVNYWSKKYSIKDKIKRILKKSDIIISVSKNLKNKLKKYNVDAIPNGVDTNLFAPIDKNKARKQLGLDLNRKIFLTVGNDFRRKGYFKLIEAFNELNIKNRLLLIAGYDRMDFRHLKDKISKLKNRSKIKLLKEIPNKRLPFYYSSSDVYCLISYSEGWPNSVMEALACGNPCVVTGQAGGEFITKDLGIVTDHKHLTENLEKALKKKWDKKKILKFAKDNSWDKTAKKVYSLFDKSINQG